MNKKSEDNYVHRHKSGKKAIVKFEDTNSSPRNQTQHENVTKRSIITSASDVSSIGERERPIGKGASTESIQDIYPLDLGKEFVDSFEETAHKQRTIN